jgi:hypothetical protein
LRRQPQPATIIITPLGIKSGGVFLCLPAIM